MPRPGRQELPTLEVQANNIIWGRRQTVWPQSAGTVTQTQCHMSLNLQIVAASLPSVR